MASQMVGNRAAERSFEGVIAIAMHCANQRGPVEGLLLAFGDVMRLGV
jgi:hypothetical protein